MASDESAAAVLSRFGVDSDRVAHAGASWQPLVATSVPPLVDLISAAPDPAMALAGWERLSDTTTDRSIVATLTADEWSALFSVLGGSQALTNSLQAAGDGFVKLLRASRESPTRDAATHARDLAGVVDAPWEQFSERLRQLRHREYLRIGLADLTGRYSVDTTMTELTALADGLFAAAYEWARRALVSQFGVLGSRGGADADAMGFVVLAMGKLGGGELNFSSDVDVVYLYEADDAESRGGPRGTLAARTYCTRLAELVTRAMQEVTASGFAFRVDLRLRPDGVNGPIANPVDNAILYYGSYGQTWERTALIPARPIAGKLALGEQFLNEVRPFVYRRNLDFTTVQDMKDMKARVEAEIGGKAGRGNVKLGRGGIREIEFLVQVLQLINGGRDERVRGRGSLPTLSKLVASGYLPADEGAALADAYRFLRNVEHKIQIVHQRQTHTMPPDAREQATLARRLGYVGTDDVTQMWADIERHTARVRRNFERMFHEPAAETRRGDPETLQLLHGLEDRDSSLAALHALGFSNAEASYENLRLLRDGPPFARARARRQQALREITPALLAAIHKSADPDLALQNLATFVSSIGARTGFLALLRENPGTLRMLVELFGGSQFLANAFIRRPDLLDSLVRADLVRVHRSTEELAAELDTVVAAAEDIEEIFEVLRRFRNQEFLRIGINNLQGLLEPEAVSAEKTKLAEVCLRSACAIAERDVCRRSGWDRLPGEYVVLALGKLGGGEITYHSDLDLIFVYDEGASEIDALVAQERFSKFVQRLITVLQATTKEGIVYRIDTRLRPSGRSGPLVSSLQGFAHYHEHSAQIWERQALIRARPVAGDPALGRRVAVIIESFVYRAPLTADEVREVRRVRGRMERELAQETAQRINIKTGRGGLVDVEFVTQMLQLYHGASEPRLRARNTLEALGALADCGVLVGDDYATLTEGYRFLRRVDNALRLAYDRPVEALERDGADLKAVAKRMGYPGGSADAAAALWREYSVRREAVRTCYDRWFDRAEAGFR